MMRARQQQVNYFRTRFRIAKLKMLDHDQETKKATCWRPSKREGHTADFPLEKLAAAHVSAAPRPLADKESMRCTDHAGI